VYLCVIVKQVWSAA